MTNHTTHPNPQEIPYGYCHCGCGQKTDIAKRTVNQRGIVKGEPLRYINHHGHGRPAIQRFWEKVDRRGTDDCWEWQASRSPNGYGYFGRGDKMGGSSHCDAASRVAWELTNGPIPKGMFVCHKCDNPPCCNPNHLFLGTQTDNLHDMHAKGRARGGIHAGTDNGNAKLTADKVREIRQRYAAGEVSLDLAHEYSVGQTTILAVIHRKTWRHIE